MEYAGFWRRFAAVLIDGLILFIPCVVFGMLLPFASVLLSFLYMTFFNSSRLMGTPGKLYMGIIVTTESGERITYQQALIRYFVAIVSGLFMFLGYLFNLFTPKRQTLHDIVAGVVVLRREVSTDVDWVNAWTEEFRRVLNIGKAGTNAGAEARGESTAASSVTATLEELHALFQKGVLTEAEYQAKKDELLKKI